MRRTNEKTTNTLQTHDPATLRRIVVKLRDLVVELREENAELRDEVDQLEHKLMRRRDPRRATLNGGPHDNIDSLLDGDLGALDEMLGLGEEATTHGNPAPADTPGAQVIEHPRSPRVEAADIDLYRSTPRPERAPSRGRGLPSRRMGRGLSPQESLERGVEARGEMPRPNVDVGYVNDVSPAELDALPYGLIVLDAQGCILFYNETESDLAGYDREQVIGKQFFGEVAPCARVKAFEGRFRDFVDGELGAVTSFDFAFHFEEGIQNVVITLSHGRKKGHYNVMLMRR